MRGVHFKTGDARVESIAQAQLLKESGAKVFADMCGLCGGSLVQMSEDGAYINCVCLECGVHVSESFPRNVQLMEITQQYHYQKTVVDDLLYRIGASKRQNTNCRVYLLMWEGNKIPFGERIEGLTIAHTQDGEVTFQNTRHVASYRRIVEFGGPNRSEHRILVFLL